MNGRHEASPTADTRPENVAAAFLTSLAGEPAPLLRDAVAPLLELPYRDARQQVLETFERTYVQELLQRHGGNIARTARAAGLPRKSLARIMARHGVSGGPDGSGGRPGRPPAGRWSK